MGKIKKILDSVHGYVEVPEEIVDKIIDTIYFQRLRRIEQTSGRSIFPSARHDRFIHSLGVYSLGVRIVNSLLDRHIGQFPNFATFMPVLYSYELACLLHDVGHTPFSHTFEGYYNNPGNKLSEHLIGLLRKTDSEFEEDFSNQLLDAAPHEIISAIIAVEIFGDFIAEAHDYRGHSIRGDKALVARMIVGCKFADNKKSFQNVFIELLHSKILDADSLDYVSRDAWASGYLSSKVDTARLLSSVTIYKDGVDNYSLCYDIKAINEIRAALNVKNFQQENVINHHTVIYEQALLKKAMESAALLYGDQSDVNDQAKRREYLGKICSLDGFLGKLPSGDLRNYPTDDYFICMMRQHPDCIYVSEWFSRKYRLKPLWKSRERFWYSFRKFRFEELNSECWLYSERCKKFLSDKFNIDVNDIWIEEATPKNKLATIAGLKILIEGKPVNYTSIFSMNALGKQELLTCFKFIFIPEKDKSGKDCDFQEIRKSLVKEFFTTTES